VVENIKGDVRLFLAKYIGSRKLDDNENIFQSLHLNSLFAMQLVMYIEKQIGFQLSSNDLDIENFKSISAIARFVEGKMANGDCSTEQQS
jgi:methoxymalonate biosynthesis acyl carrier protein